VAETGAQSRAVDDGGDAVDGEVHVREGGRPRADHLQRGEFGSRLDVVRRERRLDRPDVLAEPGVERLVVGVPAQQRHRGVRVSVDQPGDHQSARRVERRRGVGGARLVADGENPSRVAVDDDVVRPDAAVGVEHTAARDTQRVHATPFRPAGLIASVRASHPSSTTANNTTARTAPVAGTSARIRNVRPTLATPRR